MIGDHLKLVENVPEGTAFCFDGKTKKQKIDQNDIIRELFDLGMGGSYYAQVVKVPEEIHGVICQNDLMAEGCVYALEAKGMAGSISVIGIDGQRSVAEKIAEGEIDGTVWQNPEMAVDAVKRLTDYLEGDLRSGNIYTEIVPLTPDNVQEYLDEGLAW